MSPGLTWLLVVCLLLGSSMLVTGFVGVGTRKPHPRPPGVKGSTKLPASATLPLEPLADVVYLHVLEHSSSSAWSVEVESAITEALDLVDVDVLEFELAASMSRHPSARASEGPWRTVGGVR